MKSNTTQANTTQAPKPFKQLCGAVLGTRRLSSQKRQLAGKHFWSEFDINKQLTASEYPKTAAFLLEHAAVEGEIPPNLTVPVKTNIIAQSRPFEEWPISKANYAIQAYIYGLPLADLPNAKDLESKTDQEAWFLKSGIQTHGYTDVQGLNLIIKNAINTYQGVITKVENRNEDKRKEKERLLANGISPDKIDIDDAEKATGDDGNLLQPPGINHSVFCYQQVSGTDSRSKKSKLLWNPTKHPDLILPDEYKDVVINTDAPISSAPERKAYKEGQPGYIPEWQRPLLSTNKHKRRRAYYSANRLKPAKNRVEKTPEKLAEYAKAKVTQVIPSLIRIGDDWVIFDLRGLYRNVRWRDLSRNPSISDLLNFFTGDPVIDTKRNLVVFSYKKEKLGIVSRKPALGKQTRELLEKLTATDADGKFHEVGMVMIDLNARPNNYLTAAITRIGRDDSGVLPSKPNILHRFRLPADILVEYDKYRQNYDAFKGLAKKAAIASLSEEQQKEIASCDANPATLTKSAICKVLGLEETNLPWEKMDSHTFFISDAWLAANGGQDTNNVVHFITTQKGKKSQTKVVKRTDRHWMQEHKPRLVQETRKALSEAEWMILRDSEDYKRLSKFKQELARRSVNYVLRETKRITQCDVVIPAIEKGVGTSNRMWSGSGKRAVGWDQFFQPKSENRWFIQALHKAFEDLTRDKGMYVIEVAAAYTSQTCPDCGHCDGASRNGEKFACTKCGKTFNADLEVATHGIGVVALTGKRLPGPCERSGDAQTPTNARKPKFAKSQAKLAVAANTAPPSLPTKGALANHSATA